jgi:uncharacterized membrane protein
MLMLGGRNHATPIAYLFRMTTYPDAYPLQYAAVVAIPFALLTSLWTIAVYKKLHAPRWLQIAGVIGLSVAVSSVLGGLLYELHDMQAGYFPDRDIMINHFQRGAWWGLSLGPIIVAFSVPLNICALLLAYTVAGFTQRTFGT